MTKQIIGRGREFGGICVAALVFIGTWFLRMSSFLRMSLSLHPRPTLVKGEADDLLVYTIASPVAPLVLAPVKPLITHVYTRRQNPPVSGPPLVRHQIQFLTMISLLLFVKVDVSVFIQFPHFEPITSCLPNHVFLLLLWTLFHCLTLFRKPCLILIGVVL